MSTPTTSFRNAFATIFALTVLTLAIVSPFIFGTRAAKGLLVRTESHDPQLPNYDIRTDREAVDKVTAFRTGAGRTASDTADILRRFCSG
jgi:hypothetical protein